MIRSYLGYIEKIEMILRRLTKTQKTEILEAYIAGDSTNLLAEKYSCTPNTINRTVKTLLSEDEYKLLKKNRLKINNKNQKSIKKKNLKEEKDDIEKGKSITSLKGKVKEEDLRLEIKEESNESELNEIASIAFGDDDLAVDFSSKDKKNKKHENNQNFDNNFAEIAPLLTGLDFDLNNQKSDFEILNYESLPESVYMIVDKKVELDLHPISDFPEWSFLPENELERNAIVLFSNQRSAKRICSRNQRVIKIPNTSIFELSKSYLISKGITRLILEDLIIGLDD